MRTDKTPPWTFSDQAYGCVIHQEQPQVEILAAVVNFTIITTPIDFAFGDDPERVVYHLRLP